MIDEKKLIKELSKNSVFEKITNAEGKNVFEIIKTQPQVGGWIPVSERLPAEEGRYLCAYGKNEMNVYPFSNDLYSVDDYDFAEYKFEKKKGFYTDYSEWGYCEANFIKAWQPLPEAYKESEEE